MASVQLTLCMVMKWKCYSDEAIQLSESQILPPLVPPSGNDDDFSFIGLFEQLGGEKSNNKNNTNNNAIPPIQKVDRKNNRVLPAVPLL